MSKTNYYNIPVTVFRDGNLFVAYSTALDLSSCGKTENQAKKMFEKAVDLFFEELNEMGTLDVVLKDLGWTKRLGVFQPPRVVEQSILSVAVPSFA